MSSKDPTPNQVLKEKIRHTGSFLYEKRKACEARVFEKGQEISTQGLDLNYLITGVCATGAWAYSHFGRKIEKAIAFNYNGADEKYLAKQTG